MNKTQTTKQYQAPVLVDVKAIAAPGICITGGGTKQV
jgi:hypothetical protein